MEYREAYFTGSGGRRIHCHYWDTGLPRRALLLVAHGAGEHGGRYRELAAHFTGHGYTVAAMDHNGHGRSEGIPGYVGSFADYVDDLGSFHRQAVERCPDTPVVLLGHSLGGLIVGHYLLRPAVTGIACAALSGPLVAIEPDPGAVQRAAVRILGSLLPRLGVLKLSPEGISRDPQVVADYTADPLVFHGNLSARMLREMFAAMDDLRAGAARIDLPLLLLHGERDRMTSPQGTRALHDAVRSNDKTLTIYPGLYHEIFNEPEREQVLEDLRAWCDRRL